MLTNNDKKLYTVKDVRNELNCSQQWAYQLMKHKDFPSFKLGRRIYVRKTDFDLFIEDVIRRKGFDLKS